MFLNKVFDPRDNLERSRRMELFKFAQANGVSEIRDDMPASLMRRILRQRNLTHIAPPRRTLGLAEPRNGRPAQPMQPANEVSADDILAAEWAQQDRKPSIEKMGIQELRAECKRRGIKLARTDNIKTLRDKLGKNAS